jgi:hypothetical protein
LVAPSLAGWSGRPPVTDPRWMACGTSGAASTDGTPPGPLPWNNVAKLAGTRPPACPIPCAPAYAPTGRGWALGQSCAGCAAGVATALKLPTSRWISEANSGRSQTRLERVSACPDASIAAARSAHAREGAGRLLGRLRSGSRQAAPVRGRVVLSGFARRDETSSRYCLRTHQMSWSIRPSTRISGLRALSDDGR